MERLLILKLFSFVIHEKIPAFPPKAILCVCSIIWRSVDFEFFVYVPYWSYSHIFVHRIISIYLTSYSPHSSSGPLNRMFVFMSTQFTRDSLLPVPLTIISFSLLCVEWSIYRRKIYAGFGSSMWTKIIWILNDAKVDGKPASNAFLAIVLVFFICFFVHCCPPVFFFLRHSQHTKFWMA